MAAADTVVAATGKPWARVLTGGKWPGVELTLAHLARAAELGRRQYEKSKNHPAHGATTDPDTALAMNIMGRQAEFAAAAYYGAPEPTEDTGRVFDVGQRTQVRGVARQSLCLIHRPADKPTDPFVSVLCWPPYFYLRGWLPGHLCRNPKWWRQPNPPRPGLWLVPASELAPIETLEAVFL